MFAISSHRLFGERDALFEFAGEEESQVSYGARARVHVRALARVAQEENA